MVCIYNGILLSHKKNEIMPFAATWIDLEMIILAELSQREKDKYHTISHVECTKMTQLNLYTKLKCTYGHRKQTYDYRRGKGIGKIRSLGLTDILYYI